MLISLATVAEKHNLCGRLFPDAIREFQKDTGLELSAAVRRIAAMLEVAHDRGSHYSSRQVAQILRGYAGRIQRGEDIGKIDSGPP